MFDKGTKMALLLSTLGSCEMPENGPWTTYDVDDAANGVHVINGVLSGTDPQTEMIRRAYLNELTDIPNEYVSNAENVNRVKQIFTENDWDQLFPSADAMYTYDGLMMAIAHYSSFCGVDGDTSCFYNGATNYQGESCDDAFMTPCGCETCTLCYPGRQTHEEICRAELATLFAHMTYETNCSDEQDGTDLKGLCLKREQSCYEYTTDQACDYKYQTGTYEGDAFPPEDDQQYFGRGATMLKWNSFYGQFGAAYWFDRLTEDQQFLLLNPKKLATDSGLSFTSALWRYMTPLWPKPSIHDVIIGKFQTSSQDHYANIHSNAWGVTINIMNGDGECRSGAESPGAQARALYYEYFSQYLNNSMYINDGDLGCKLHSDWPEDNANQAYQIASWWAFDSTKNKCKLVEYFTKYSIYNKDDYKRCVCSNMEQPGKCQQVGPRFAYWSETTESLAYTTANVDVYIGQSTSYDIWAALQNFNINPEPVGVTLATNNAFYISFWTISLTEDNIGRTVGDAGFESDYTSSNDPYAAVPDTYIATSLQQYSARVDDGDSYPNTFTFDYDQSLLGTWTFQIQTCIDRSNYNEFDCSGYFEKFITFTLLDPCENPDDVPDNTELIEDICVLDEEVITEVIDYLPYFDTSWEDNELVQVIAGDKITYDLPDTYDCCDNTIDISVNLNGVTTFINFLQSTNQIVIQPSLNQFPTLYRIPITLDNSILTSVYYLSIVVHSPDQTIPGAVEPALPIQNHEEIVQPIVNATVNNETAPVQLTETQQQILQATNEFGEKLFEQFLIQQQPQNDEEQEHPTVIVQSFSKNGDLTLTFSQPMIVPYFTSEYSFSTGSHGTRLLREVDLASLIECDFKQDAKGSVPIGQYNVTMIAYRPTEMVLQFDFQNPLHISAGNEFDAIECEIKNSAFFMSSETFLTVEEDTAFQSVVPRQFQSTEEYITVLAVGTTIEAASQISFLVQIVIMILVGISLKLMWNLMNVMQVLAFLRFFANCPQIMNTILLSVHNSITFDPLVEKILDYSKSQFEIASTQLSDEELQKVGINNQSIFRSLGIFAFLFMLLAILTMIFLLLNFLHRRYKEKLHPHVKTIQKILKKKLQYQSFVRYLIESNLKITHTSLFFLVLTGSFSSVGEAGVTILRAVLLFAAISFPVFVVWFLNTHRNDLEESKFFEKWNSMYVGIKLEHRVSLFYTAVFCLRRILLVLCLLTFGQEHDKLIIFGAIAIQSTYLGYILYVEPHTENIFNILEVINECAVVLLLYIMFAFGTDSLLTLQEQQTAGYIAFGLLIIVFLVNIGVMIKFSLGKVYKTLKMKKQKKTDLAAKENFKKSQAKKTVLETIIEKEELNFYRSQAPEDQLVSNKSDLEGSISESSNSDYENEQQTLNFNRLNQSQCVEESSRPNRVPSHNPDANIPDPRKFKSLVNTSGIVVDGLPRMSTPTKQPVNRLISTEYHLETNKDEEEKKVELITVSQYQGLHLERLTERSAHNQPPNSSQQQQRCESFVQQHSELQDVVHISDIDSIDNEEQKVPRKNSGGKVGRYESHVIDPVELLSNVMQIGKDYGGTLDKASKEKDQKASCLYDYAPPSPSVRQLLTPALEKQNKCLGVLVPANKYRNSSAQLQRKDKAISKKSSQMSNLYTHKGVKEKKIGSIYDDMSELY